MTPNPDTDKQPPAGEADKELRKWLNTVYEAHHPGTSPAPKAFLDDVMLFMPSQRERDRLEIQNKRAISIYRNMALDNIDRMFRIDRKLAVAATKAIIEQLQLTPELPELQRLATQPTAPEYTLQHCPVCNQMTNHKLGDDGGLVCAKHGAGSTEDAA